jgi:hypothetical protein
MRSWQTWVPSLLQGFGVHWSGRSELKDTKEKLELYQSPLHS